MVLVDKDIIFEQNKGTIVIAPFVKENVTTVAVDLTLGSDAVYTQSFHNRVTNVGDKKSIFDSWGAAPIIQAETIEEAVASNTQKESCVVKTRDGTSGILVYSGSSMLVHTHEFSGTVENSDIIAHAKTRSTLARSGLNLLAGAGWYDIGWIGRLGVLVENTRTACPVFVPFGTRIVQVVFERTSDVSLKTYQEHSGNYFIKTSDGHSFAALTKNWSPEKLLPPK